MKQVSRQTQKHIESLRRQGFSHRYIANTLNIALGTAAKYSYAIQLTRSQHRRLVSENFKRTIGNIPSDLRKEASKKGGINTPSHFKRKYSKNILLSKLRNFYASTGRMPTKRDFVAIYRPILRVFKSWNNAIEDAGFSPNPVLFAKKHIANDGHRCDSLAEKIIDDWLKAREIEHARNVRYFGTRFTADFRVKDIFIEYFGLHHQLKSYNILMKKKLNMIKLHKAKLISIYQTDLFPKSKLDNILGKLIT